MAAAAWRCSCCCRQVPERKWQVERLRLTDSERPQRYGSSRRQRLEVPPCRAQPHEKKKDRPGEPSPAALHAFPASQHPSLRFVAEPTQGPTPTCHLGPLLSRYPRRTSLDQLGRLPMRRPLCVPSISSPPRTRCGLHQIHRHGDTQSPHSPPKGALDPRTESAHSQRPLHIDFFRLFPKGTPPGGAAAAAACCCCCAASDRLRRTGHGPSGHGALVWAAAAATAHEQQQRLRR